MAIHVEQMFFRKTVLCEPMLSPWQVQNARPLLLFRDELSRRQGCGTNARTHIQRPSVRQPWEAGDDVQ